VLVINVSRREKFLRSDLCLDSAVPGECLNDGKQAKTPAHNVLFMANGPQSVDVTCGTGMRDSSSGGAGRMASNRAGRGVAAAASAAAASAGPDANPTTAQRDLPVPGDLCVASHAVLQ